MNVLIVGGGGREHAIAQKLSESPQRPKLYVAPGNAGTAQIAENVAIGAEDINGLLAFAQDHDVDLTVVGPEAPLVNGLVDRFEAAGLHAIGPTAYAAQLEGSKAFAKAFMAQHGIPTAAYRVFEATARAEATAFIAELGAPLVLKADGLAGGKGVLICQTEAEAHAGLQKMWDEAAFGSAGQKLVIEAFMEGEEASIFALTDGADYVLLSPAQDHKRIGEGDTGPNTGGMGAYAPAPIITPDLLDQIRQTIIEPTLRGMAEAGHPYRGILYAGLMITPSGPKVVEYNCRFGDPETQVVLPLLNGDLLALFQHIAHRTMHQAKVTFHTGSAAGVVLASAGYPGSYEKGKIITGTETSLPQQYIFHAGTRQAGGDLVTSGGRVLAVCGLGSDLQAALDTAYAGVANIDFAGKTYRRDIGHRALNR